MVNLSLNSPSITSVCYFLGQFNKCKKIEKYFTFCPSIPQCNDAFFVVLNLCYFFVLLYFHFTFMHYYQQSIIQCFCFVLFLDLEQKRNLFNCSMCTCILTYIRTYIHMYIHIYVYITQ